MGLTKRFLKEKGVQGRCKRTDGGRMTDRNRELVPDNWSLGRERALTSGQDGSVKLTLIVRMAP